ncbi:antitoxin [Streptomyces triticagri]|uniref:Antitoxin n=1 Tax=Streptomyces triticagri TaxID=2293568 RepID=A0A372M0N7_9ACTN|nr:antitoxin [Streptomyces triticagri]RFU84472.1 antitoxin [Streptomyces triticagri]
MGLLDSLKAKLGPAKDKVSGLAQEHGDKIDQGLDKAAKTVDEKTKGKYSDQIRTGKEKAKGAVDRLGSQEGSPGGADSKGTGDYSPQRPVGDGPERAAGDE